VSEDKLTRLVEIANDPQRDKSERAEALATIRKVAPHLIPPGYGASWEMKNGCLPSGEKVTTHWILTPTQHERFERLSLKVGT
jgi:hypothetical protein